MKSDLVYFFRAKPYRKGTLYARVFVFQNRRSMREYAKQYKDIVKPSLCAYVDEARIFRTRDNKRLPIACDIHLCVGYLDLNTISHECVHAAMDIVKRKYPKAWREERDGVEETVAYTQANLLVKIVLSLKKAGLLDKDHSRPRPMGWAEARITGVAA